MSNITATANEVEPCHYTLDVQVAADEVTKNFKKARNEARNRASIKGFRKGKAPDALINTRFGKQITEEVSQQLTRNALETAIAQEELVPVTMPTITSDVEAKPEDGKEFTFSVEFDVRPKFELPDYEGLELERTSSKVTDEMIDETIKQMVEMRAPYGPVERESQAGDMLKVSLKADLGEEEEVPDAAKRLVDNDESWLLLSEPEMLPGIIEGLVGLTAGDAKDLDITFGDDHHEPFLAGKTLTYHFEVGEVQGKSTAELDDETAKQLGAESADDLKSKVRERLESQQEQSATEQLNAQAIEKVLERVDFALPPKQLEQETANTLAQLRQRNQKLEDVDDETFTRQLKEDAEKQAKDRLSIHYLVEAIAKKEEIEVNADEIQQQMSFLKDYSGMTDQQFSEQYDPYRMAESFYSSLLQSKVVSKLIEKANVSETEAEKADDAAEPTED